MALKRSQSREDLGGACALASTGWRSVGRHRMTRPACPRLPGTLALAAAPRRGEALDLDRGQEPILATDNEVRGVKTLEVMPNSPAAQVGVRANGDCGAGRSLSPAKLLDVSL
jgi:hypothetical protein